MTCFLNAVATGSAIVAGGLLFVDVGAANAKALHARTYRPGVYAPHRFTDGHPVVCGGGISTRVYAADHYIARPLICGGGPVNNNLNPDFQLGGR